MAPGSCSLAVLPPGSAGSPTVWRVARAGGSVLVALPGMEAEAAELRRSPAPASLIGSPPCGTAPSGCPCTGRSRPRRGSRRRSRTPTALGTPGGWSARRGTPGSHPPANTQGGELSRVQPRAPCWWHGDPASSLRPGLQASTLSRESWTVFERQGPNPSLSFLWGTDRPRTEEARAAVTF